MSKHPLRLPAGSPYARQDGVVLMVALIILVAMTLAGVALIRSVDTANVIAGNLAFHQSATNAGERSTEFAINDWLIPGTGAGLTALNTDNANAGYVASRTASSDLAAKDSWDAFWNSIPAEQKRRAPPSVGTCPSDASADLACNRVEYVIHRLCATTGKPNTATNRCTQRPPGSSSGESFGAGGVAPTAPKQVYYRITTRIEGPRRTVSYIQTIIAL